MSDARTYPAGVPCWIDTEQPDAPAARDFYTRVFDWTFTRAGESYWIATLHGQDVAGIGVADSGAAEWNTYVAVDDAGEAAARLAAAGGRVTSEPVGVGRAGRMAIADDPTGAQLRIWQAGERPGAQLVNAAGAWNFSDLHTHDVQAAKAFYATVFGWACDGVDLEGDAVAAMWRRPGYGDHLEATVDPDIRARQAAISAPPGFEDAIAWLASSGPDETPHWHVTFAVADRDHVAAVAEGCGATVVSSEDTQWTKTALIRDPQGAELTLSQFDPGAGESAG